MNDQKFLQFYNYKKAKPNCSNSNLVFLKEILQIYLNFRWLNAVMDSAESGRTQSGTALSWSWMLTRVPLSWNSNECWNKGPTALRTMILGYVLHLQVNFDNFSEIFTTANTFCTKKLTQCCHLKLLIHVTYLNFEHSNPFCL